MYYFIMFILQKFIIPTHFLVDITKKLVHMAFIKN